MEKKTASSSVAGGAQQQSGGGCQGLCYDRHGCLPIKEKANSRQFFCPEFVNFYKEKLTNRKKYTIIKKVKKEASL